MIKIPSLDGLRAVSILLVVVGHLANGSSWSHNAARTVLANAALGVNVFFVISGFLITTLLLREFTATGGVISLTQFYFRRAFRILPPYYFYLLVIFLLSLAGILSLPQNALTSAAIFAWNYWPVSNAWYLDHMWSLAVEEQFYMVWPILLAWALGHRNRHLAGWIALTVILLSPLVRVGTYFLAPESIGTQLY